jgi:hypothetical protein
MPKIEVKPAKLDGVVPHSAGSAHTPHKHHQPHSASHSKKHLHTRQHSHEHHAKKRTSESHQKTPVRTSSLSQVMGHLKDAVGHPTHTRSAFDSLYEGLSEEDKANNPLDEFDFEELPKLKKTQLDQIWKSYDPKKKEKMSKHYCSLLSDHCLRTKLKMYEDNLRNSKRFQKKPLTDEQVEASIKKEYPFLLPGGPKDEREGVHFMFQHIMGQFDVNHKHYVTKLEFEMQWGHFSADLFAPMKVQKSGLSCTVL